MTDADSPAPAPRPGTFAEKLNRLFEVLHPADRKPWSTREVAARVKEQGGSVSPAYISELRNGVKTNPGLDHVLWLAAAFGVSAGYFTDPEVAERVDRELDAAAARHRDARLVDLAEQTASLDPTDRAALHVLVQDYLQKRGPGQEGHQDGDPHGADEHVTR